MARAGEFTWNFGQRSIFTKDGTRGRNPDIFFSDIVPKVVNHEIRREIGVAAAPSLCAAPRKSRRLVRNSFSSQSALVDFLAFGARSAPRETEVELA